MNRSAFWCPNGCGKKLMCYTFSKSAEYHFRCSKCGFLVRNRKDCISLTKTGVIAGRVEVHL